MNKLLLISCTIILNSQAMDRAQIDVRCASLAIAAVQQKFTKEYPNHLLVDAHRGTTFNVQDLDGNTFERSPRGKTFILDLAVVDATEVDLCDPEAVKTFLAAKRSNGSIDSPRTSI